MPVAATASAIFFGGSVIAAVIAGGVSLFAPCCISVMLPAYFASAFQNRRQLVAMTFLFAAGVATVILPIALGAAAIQRFLTGQHAIVYSAAGLVLVALSAYLIFGGSVRLPVPGRRADGKTGPLSVYSLGAFSGVASSCCAPVLAGVAALSGVAASFGVALGLGAAYVFGMVAPLFVISLLWERYDWRSSRLFTPRSFTWRIGPRRRTVPATALISAALLAAIGAWTLWIGLTRSAMPSPSGWQADVSSHLQHWGSVLTKDLAWIPGWVAALALGGVLLLLARRAIRQLLPPPGLREPPSGERFRPMADPKQGRRATQERALEEEHAAARRRLATWITATVVGAVALLALLFIVSNNNTDSSPQSSSGGNPGSIGSPWDSLVQGPRRPRSSSPRRRAGPSILARSAARRCCSTFRRASPASRAGLSSWTSIARCTRSRPMGSTSW